VAWEFGDSSNVPHAAQKQSLRALRAESSFRASVVKSHSGAGKKAKIDRDAFASLRLGGSGLRVKTRARPEALGSRRLVFSISDPGQASPARCAS
jgi:hypothetical protein